LYTDDFAEDIDELVLRLRLIFERFRKYDTFSKANKTFPGYPEIDCVGKNFLLKDLKCHTEEYARYQIFQNQIYLDILKGF
jgi:hypothetical protein